MLRSPKLIYYLWSLAPWGFLALGLQHFRSIAWTFFLYHFLCLLPAILYKPAHWKPYLKKPSRRQIVALLVSALLFSLMTYLVYGHLGGYIINRDKTLHSLYSRGFTLDWLYPLSLYFITVNPVLEELFWRGVILNELCEEGDSMYSFPVIWTNCAFAAWHFLVIRLFITQFFMVPALLTVMSVGFLLSWLFRRRKSLVISILWHSLVFDMAVVIILFMVIYGS